MNSNNEYLDNEHSGFSSRARGILRRRTRDYHISDEHLPATNSPSEHSSSEGKMAKSTARTATALIAALVPLVTPMLLEFVNDDKRRTHAKESLRNWLVNGRKMKPSTANHIVDTAEKAALAAAQKLGSRR